MDLQRIEKILKKEPDEAAEELLKEVEKAYGEIPYILDFMKQSPELLVTKILYDNAIFREFKRLDLKTIELISIGVSAALRCEHCLKMHIRVARRLGVTKEEIFDAILIAGSLSNAAVLAEGTRAIDSEKLKDECEVCGIPEEREEG
ncbi:alkylhydroperoxidase AhpD family core domain [Candidatus Methanoperedens nitroreducens]|uniref:Alkylhydroperoxidase AhpD family core domain n=1 Tax=Candidatus Methanoperedens nitratireducens TaxID=1392998 RepID=A0A062V9V3_9EURY|nr:carboxymuconolactone decarboxylase family protein [Candidatus Methanoperedens nitroreducens]KCZ72130.1 alkylhydroperoxidase AhpD family core domain [Candidatus Methanoperedens nitroreducens]MDJ1421893.1 carboxymuconolactone decarboxylase family protein [Candidatus Methanoperedens sp.]